MKALMGIDMGGTMVKAAVFDLEGNELATWGEKLTTLQPRPGQTERDMDEAKEKIFRCVRQSIGKAGVSGEDILGIGVTGQGNGAYLFDGEGNPVRNGVMSSDVRAKEYIRKWRRDGTCEKIYPYTRQQLWSGNICALIAWFQDNEKEALDKAAYIVTAKDYVRYLLTGEFHTEITEGSGTSCMDLESRQYSREVFRNLGIEPHLQNIPAPIGSSEIGGYVLEEAARATNLAPGIPVVGGQFDVSASIVSAGVIREGQMGIVVGSWGINSVLSKTLVDDPELFMQYIYAVPGFYNLLEGSATSAANLEWFVDTCMERNEGIYAKCDEMVSSAPYRDSLLFFPYLYGSNVNIDAKAMFVGLSGTHGKAHMLRAIYEGVVFCHKLHIERLLRHVSMPDTLQMAGGAVRSAAWMQMFADILGANVEISRAIELGTMGVALNAGIAAGVFGSMEEAIARWAKVKHTYFPDREKTVYYQKKYHAFKSVLTAMDGVWGEIDALVEV